MEKEKLSQIIQQKSIELGFDLFGVTDKIIPRHFDKFQQWLNDGNAGEMNYLNRNNDIRQDPQLLLNGVKSIIVVGVNYYQPPNPTPPDYGKISIYSYGKDYHKAIRKRLKKLLEFIKEKQPETEGRICVDSAPILERDFAQSAGLGWYGKNSCLINPEIGSFFFIGCLLTTVELTASQPVEGDCGSCERCVKACPTKAIVKPNIIDARRCVSYLTIENKEEIPVELRSRLSNQIFGCDICQSVCPYNKPVSKYPRRGATTQWQEFTQTVLYKSLTLSKLLSLTPDNFTDFFAGTPMVRAGWRGMMRNALVASGNSGDLSLIPLIETYKEISDPVLSSTASWALTKLRSNTNNNK